MAHSGFTAGLALARDWFETASWLVRGWFGVGVFWIVPCWFAAGRFAAGLVLVRDWFAVASRLLRGCFAWLVPGWVTSI